MGVVWTHEAVLMAGICDIVASTCVVEGQYSSTNSVGDGFSQ